MVPGRLVKARNICIFCVSRADAAKPRAFRRIHTSSASSQAAGAAAAYAREDAHSITASGRQDPPSISEDKGTAVPVGGTRYSSQKELPAWKQKAFAAQRPASSPAPTKLSPTDQVPQPLSQQAFNSSRFGQSRVRRNATSRGLNAEELPSQATPRITRYATDTNHKYRPQPLSSGGNREIKSRKGRVEDLTNKRPNIAEPEVGKSETSTGRREIRWTKVSRDYQDGPSEIVVRRIPPAEERKPEFRVREPRWSLPKRSQNVAEGQSTETSSGEIARFQSLAPRAAQKPPHFWFDKHATENAQQKGSNSIPLGNQMNDRQADTSKFVGFREDSAQDERTTQWSASQLATKDDIQPENPKKPVIQPQVSARRAAFFAEEEEADQKRAARKSRQASRRTTEDDEEDMSYAKLQRIEEKQRRKAERKVSRQDQASGQTFYVPSFISIGNLATALKIRAGAFSKVLRDQGFADLSNDHVLDAETAGLIASELGFKAILPAKVSATDLVAQPPPTETDLLPARPPIVTIMGHVDHGKTTLLDWLRNSSVAASEFGGITQHIGAFTVQMPSGRIITFLDTPGHAAFLEMRARGANVTDIVILVVAADDSVKPQTIEAIKHAKAARTQIVVAISKIDKPEADAERVKQDLARHGIDVEDYGGDVQTVCVSGKTGQGMDQLEDAVIALADVLDVKADTAGDVEGWVLEAARKASGKIATVLVRRGTLKSGQIIVAGHAWARVRNLRNESGAIVDEALPGTPVEVDGWDEQPSAGAEVLQAPNEQRARRVVEYRKGQSEIEKQAADVAAVNEARQLQEEKRLREKAREQALKRGEEVEEEKAEVKSRLTEVPLIIKADVSGSVEAVNASLLSLGNSEIRATVIRAAVGAISESDIEHAAAIGGQIVNFNIPIDGQIALMAEKAGVNVIDGNIIYRVTDDVKSLLEDKLPPVIIPSVTGEADILQVFEISLKGRKTLPVAGCKVRNGTMTKGSKVKVLRGDKVIYDGILSTLKNQKKDAAEMRKGNECGMSFDDFKDFKAGDQIQCYETKTEKRRL